MRGILLLTVLTLLAGCTAPSPGPVPGPAPDHGPDPAPARLARSDSGAYAGLSLHLVANASAPGGYALRVHEDRAYVATFSTLEGISVFNVTNPLAPVHLGGTPPGTLARSVDVLDYGNLTAVALSTGTELEVWNLTDPANPALLASLPFGSHNVAVHPDAKVVYNARNLWDGVGGAVEIVNASDPANVHLDHVWTFPPFAQDGSPVHNQGCHDFTVWPAQDRAYCAAYEQTLILDIADPLHPEILTAITNPAITSHHTAFPILGHTVLAISDEFADNLMWGCLGHEVSGLPEAPVGGFWFYDLTTSPPRPLGYLGGPRVTPEPWFLTAHGINAMCGSHNGAESPDDAGLVAYGWFDAGLALVDASDPAAPVLLDLQDVAGAYGDARWHDGYVLAVDDKTGLTVFEVV